MPYQGLLFAAVFGIGLAVAIGVFLANGAQWEQAQTYGEGTRRRREEYHSNNNRRESKNDDQPICTICRDKLGGFLRTLKCKHTYHTDCIQEWFRRQRSDEQPMHCPVCREPSAWI